MAPSAVGEARGPVGSVDCVGYRADVRCLFALLIALLVSPVAHGQDWKDRYRRADVVQTVGGLTFTASTLSAAVALGWFAPNHWGKGTKFTNGVGAAFMYTAAAGFVLGPPVMLGGALVGRGALRDAPLFTLQGPSGVYGSGRGGRLGVLLWVGALSAVPVALFTRDRVVWLGLVPLALSWYAAAALVANNRTAWDELNTDTTAASAARVIVPFSVRF